MGMQHWVVLLSSSVIFIVSIVGLAVTLLSKGQAYRTPSLMFFLGLLMLAFGMSLIESEVYEAISATVGLGSRWNYGIGSVGMLLAFSGLGLVFYVKKKWPAALKK